VRRYKARRADIGVAFCTRLAGCRDKFIAIEEDFDSADLVSPRAVLLDQIARLAEANRDMGTYRITRRACHSVTKSIWEISSVSI
jgi:hypothetical protein